MKVCACCAFLIAAAAASAACPATLVTADAAACETFSSDAAATSRTSSTPCVIAEANVDTERESIMEARVRMESDVTRRGSADRDCTDHCTAPEAACDSDSDSDSDDADGVCGGMGGV